MGRNEKSWNITERWGTIQNVAEVLWGVAEHYEHYRALCDVMERYGRVTVLLRNVWNCYGKYHFCPSLTEF